MKKTIIIAEAGVNHNGQIELAYSLIKKAAECGADIVKFQTFKARDLATDLANKSSYQKENTDASGNQVTMLSKLQLTKTQHLELIDYSKTCGIEFLSTGFDIKSLEFLKSLDLKRYKVPSGEITNYPYLYKVGGFKKEIILSTGMANLGEIESAIDVIESAGTSRNNITVLHCSSAYPAPIYEANLKSMKTISKAFGVKVGYSDHTLGTEVAIAAVALGASIIEKHITLNRNLDGPDHQASTEPEEFQKMVQAIRNVDQALGNGIKKSTPSEQENILLARKSIVASKKIKKGETFNHINLSTKRPASGISPMRWNDFIGKQASRDYEEDELII